MRCRRSAERGFTLMELLVAVALFAAVSAVAYGGLRTAMTTHQATALHADRVAALQRAFGQMQLDLAQLVDRPGRDAQGENVAAFELTGSTGQPSLALVRGGRSNPAGLPRSSLQRLEYRYRADRLERLAWHSLDRVQGQTPDARPLIVGVDNLHWRFLDDAGGWHDDWPPLRRGVTVGGLPAAVELVIDTDMGEIRRLFSTGVGS